MTFQENHQNMEDSDTTASSDDQARKAELEAEFNELDQRWETMTERVMKRIGDCSDPPEKWFHDAIMSDPLAFLAGWLSQANIDYVGPAVFNREYETGAGPCDVFGQFGDYYGVIIEVKRGEANEAAVAQTLRYIGALQERDANRKIFGIVTAPRISRNALLAAKASGITCMQLGLKAIGTILPYTEVDLASESPKIVQNIQNVWTLASIYNKPTT